MIRLKYLLLHLIACYIIWKVNLAILEEIYTRKLQYILNTDGSTTRCAGQLVFNN